MIYHPLSCYAGTFPALLDLFKYEGEYYIEAFVY
jgi:hypothetical protein